MSSAEAAAKAGKGNGVYWKQFAAACLLALGGQGLVYNAIGNYITPLMYVTGQGTAAIGGAISVASLAMMVELALVGKILRKVPLKRLLIIGAVIGLGSFVAMGYVKSMPVLYLLFVLWQLGGAIPVYVAGPMLVTNWFEKKKGLLTGIMMVFANGGLIFGALAAGALLGPEPYNTGLAFTTMGIISLVLIIIGASMSIISPAVLGLKPYGASDDAASEGAAAAKADVPGISGAAAMKSFAFIGLFVCVFFMVCCGSFYTLLSNFANATYGYTNAQASVIMSIDAAGSTIGCLIWGILDDRIGATTTTVIAFLCIALGLLGMALLASTYAALVAFVFIFGFGCSATGVQVPIMVSRFFGQKDYGAIYSKIAMAQSLAGLIAVVSIGAVAQAAGSYVPAVMVLAALMVIAIIVILAARSSAKKLWSKSGQTMSAKL